MAEGGVSAVDEPSATKRPAGNRAIYRPQALRYLERRTFGEPIEVRPLSSWWCVPPIVAVALLALALCSLSFRPRLRAVVVNGGGAAAVVVEAPSGRDLPLVGDEVDVRAGAQSRRLAIAAVRDTTCDWAERCRLLTGRFDAPLSAAGQAVVILPGRKLIAFAHKKD